MRKWVVCATVILATFGTALPAEAAANIPRSRADCMGEGWKNYDFSGGFKNRGECIAWVQRNN